MPSNTSPPVIKRKSSSPQQIVFKSKSKSFKLFLKFIEGRSKKEDLPSINLPSINLPSINLPSINLDEKEDLEYLIQIEEPLQFELDL